MNWLQRIRRRFQAYGTLDLYREWLASQLLTRSGVSVSEYGMVGLPAVYACVRVLSEVLASTPWHLAQRNADGTIGRVMEHPASDVVTLMPNVYQTPYEFLELMHSRLVIRHNSYALIDRRGDGSLMSLRPVHPAIVETWADPKTGAVKYDVMWPDRDPERDIPASKMLHLRGFSDNGFTGWSPLSIVGENIGNIVATERVMQHTMANSTFIPGFLRSGGNPRTRDKVRTMMADLRGPGEAGKVPVIPGDVEFVKMGMTFKEIELLAHRRMHGEDIARMFRVQPHVVGFLDNATYSNIEEQNREFLELTMLPWFMRWEQRLDHTLLRMSERKSGLHFHFDYTNMLRVNLKDRYDSYATAIQWGFKTRNEVRADEKMIPLEHLDEPLIPLNTETVEDRAASRYEEPDPEPVPSQVAEDDDEN